jgi:quinolinate synthase
LGRKLCSTRSIFYGKNCKQLADNPDAKLIAHPESEEAVLKLAHFIGSTSALLNYVEKDDCQKFIIATEEGILHEMKNVLLTKN